MTGNSIIGGNQHRRHQELNPLLDRFGLADEGTEGRKQNWIEPIFERYYPADLLEVDEPGPWVQQDQEPDVLLKDFANPLPAALELSLEDYFTKQKHSSEVMGRFGIEHASDSPIDLDQLQAAVREADGLGTIEAENKALSILEAKASSISYLQYVAVVVAIFGSKVLERYIDLSDWKDVTGTKIEIVLIDSPYDKPVTSKIPGFKVTDLSTNQVKFIALYS